MGTRTSPRKPQSKLALPTVMGMGMRIDLPFKKLVACYPKTGERKDLTFLPISIPLERLSDADILNLKIGNNFKQTTRKAVLAVAVAAAAASAGAESTKKRRVCKPKPKRQGIKLKVGVVKKQGSGGKKKPSPKTKIKIKTLLLDTLVPSTQKPNPSTSSATRGASSSTEKADLPPIASYSRSAPQPKASTGPETLPIPVFQMKVEPEEVLVSINPDDMLLPMYDSTTDTDGSACKSIGYSSDSTTYRPVSGSDGEGNQCPVCHLTFMLPEDLLIHHRSHRFSYSCEQCPKKFDCSSAQKIHLKTHGKKSSPNNQGGGSRRGKVTIGEQILKERGRPLTKVPFLSLNASASSSCGSFTPQSLEELTHTHFASVSSEDFSEDKETQKQKAEYLSHFGLVPSPKKKSESQSKQIMHTPRTPPLVLERSLVPFSGRGTEMRRPDPLMPRLKPAVTLSEPVMPYLEPANRQNQTSPSQGYQQGPGFLRNYEDALVQAEKIKKYAFAQNDSDLLHRMLEVEKHIAGRIIEARTSPNGKASASQSQQLSAYLTPNSSPYPTPSP